MDAIAVGSTEQLPADTPVTLIGDGVLAEAHAASRRRSTTRSSRGSSRPEPRAAHGARCLSRPEILAGEEAWIVGGAVRDELLGRPVVDLDIACREPEAAAATRGARTARRFRSPSATEPGAWRCPTSARSTSRPCRTASTTISPPATSRSTRSRGRSAEASRWIRSVASATSTARRFARSRPDLPGRPAPPAARGPPRGRARLPARRGDGAAGAGEHAGWSTVRRASGSSRSSSGSGRAGFERLDELGLLAPLGGSLERLEVARRHDVRDAARRGLRGAARAAADLERAGALCRKLLAGEASERPVSASIHRFRRATEPWADEAARFAGGDAELERAIDEARGAIRPSRSSAATSWAYRRAPRSADWLERIDEERAAGTISTREEALDLVRQEAERP